MDMPGLWRLKCIWSRTWKWVSRQGHQQIWFSTNPAFLENSYLKVVSSYFWMKLIIAAKQIEINNGSKLFIFFYFQPQDLEAFGSKNSVFKTKKDTNFVSRNIKKNNFVTTVQCSEALYCNISSGCCVNCLKRLTNMICYHAFNWMKTNFGLYLECTYGNTRKFLSFNPLIDTFNHFRIQKNQIF